MKNSEPATAGELLNCPFCGKDAALGTTRHSESFVKSQKWKQDIFHFVNCIECGGNNSNLVGGYGSVKEAVDHWNTRPQDRLREALGNLLQVIEAKDNGTFGKRIREAKAATGESMNEREQTIARAKAYFV